jgi:hypothetical protein
VVLLPPLAAAQKPDIAGRWKLNEAKSGRATGVPSDMIIRIRVEGPEAWFATTTRGETVEMHYNTEGQERVNQTPDATITSTVRWEGNALVGVHRLKARDWQLTQRDRITWSSDGKLMTVVRIGAGPNRRDQRLVYDRQ